MKNNEKNNAAPFLVQVAIYATILFISSIISSFFPKSFPVPTPVVGLILLYLLLTFKVIKLEWVDNFASYMISIIGFLFVPSGISLAGSLDIMKVQGLQIVTIVVLSTIIMLVVTTYVTKYVLKGFNLVEKGVTDLKEKNQLHGGQIHE